MDIFKKSYVVVLLFLLILPMDVSAYVPHAPILIENLHATADDPYLIEGYEITNPKGDGITIIDSEHIIIRNNYLHDCCTDKGFQENTDHYREGYATIIGDSSDVIFENNRLDNNYRGFIAYNTPRLKALNNEIRHTIQYSPLWCERCSDSEFAFNYLEDNGNPEIFWVPGDRSIGIWVKRSDTVNIHDNTVIRSTSDGIAVTGMIYTPSFTVEEFKDRPYPQADWSGLCENVTICNNLLLDNMEQGIWLVRARNVTIFNNTIRTGCFTPGAPISTEFDVGDSEFHHNAFLGCMVGVPGGANSFNNYIHDNTYYTFDGSKGDFMYFSDDLMGVGELAISQGAEFVASTGNREENNTWVRIGGKLAEEMEEKRDYAETHHTFERKNKDEAKGDQGVPRGQLVYSSLMENFDEYAVNEFSGSDEESVTIIEKMNEHWQTPIIVLLIVIAIIVITYIRKTKRKK